MCKKGRKSILDWYNGIAFPIRLGLLREALFDHIGIEQESIILANDDLIVNKYIPQNLTALELIKAICQLNGVCGIINRQNVFEYRTISTQSESDVYGAFPGILIPNGSYAFPGYYQKTQEGRSADSSQTEVIGYYKKFDYKDYVVKPIDKITIRNSATEEGVSYGEGENPYVIQSNMLAYGLNNEDLTEAAKNILNIVKDIEFMPFESDTNGLPYIECGKDTIKCYVLNDEGTDYVTKTFNILNREIKGIQSLRDKYVADAEEVQNEFPTDTHTQIESVVQTANNNVGEVVQEQFKQLIVSVPSLPTNWKRGVVYLIQGEVVVR